MKNNLIFVAAATFLSGCGSINATTETVVNKYEYGPKSTAIASLTLESYKMKAEPDHQNYQVTIFFENLPADIEFNLCEQISGLSNDKCKSVISVWPTELGKDDIWWDINVKLPKSTHIDGGKKTLVVSSVRSYSGTKWNKTAELGRIVEGGKNKEPHIVELQTATLSKL
ncbi:hypothetical protein [Candidatus Enterovibrio escicola]|uniref:hypothetical protein n=1 Tax=Candidatus Enterovibrio escicola TaxID=1927127 RepID=UPI001238082E|nr:hypothetical protein [Candidatus Enterovibrio escacola]